MTSTINDEPFPVIDVSPISKDNPEEGDFISIGNQIINAFDNYGFTYLKNFGLTHMEIQNFIDAGNKFFDLDQDTKLKYKTGFDFPHGYINESLERLDKTLNEDDFAKRDGFFISRLDGKFPQEVPDFETTTKIVLKKMVPVSKNIIKALEFALDAPNGLFTNSTRLMMTNDNLTLLRTTRYEPPRVEQNKIRLEEHFDFSFLTLQIYSGLKGLEIFRNGNWEESKIYPGYSLLFPGEMMQYWTADRILPLKHRVVIPDNPSDMMKYRHAAIFFMYPDNDTDIGAYNGSHKYPSIKSKDYNKAKKELYYERLKE